MFADPIHAVVPQVITLACSRLAVLVPFTGASVARLGAVNGVQGSDRCEGSTAEFPRCSAINVMGFPSQTPCFHGSGPTGTAIPFVRFGR